MWYLAGSSTQHVQFKTGCHGVYHGIKDGQGASPGLIFHYRQANVSQLTAASVALIVTVVGGVADGADMCLCSKDCSSLPFFGKH